MSPSAAPADKSERPWYRQPYLWLLIAFPAISVAAGLATLFIAAKSWDGLVVDDYYRRGMEINSDLDRDRAAAVRGLNAALELEPGAKRFRILLAAQSAQAAPQALRVSFLHRTRNGFDRQVNATLLPASAGATPFIYEAATPDLVRGRWDVLIEAANWRLLQEFTVF
ncbi:MAG: FixH family protein [Gammaproteobacteria bacterium]|nr:FixH family protein [Gammaproteobacteria bacterium]